MCAAILMYDSRRMHSEYRSQAFGSDRKPKEERKRDNIFDNQERCLMINSGCAPSLSFPSLNFPTFRSQLSNFFAPMWEHKWKPR